MTRLIEGDLVFEFPENWKVGQYDRWAFYRKRFKGCCSGNKAVDFAAVCPEPQNILWLVEVKDYRVHRRTKIVDLPLEMALKVRDSLAGIAAGRFQADDHDEKHIAEKALRTQKLRVALHIEQPLKHSKMFPRAIDPSKVYQKLKSLIKSIDPHPVVVDRSNCHALGGWRVQADSRLPSK
ncbi:hypothetical protein [Desulfonatronospira sp.]|uniref:hypothetical protein n=1 Tax=Desulfonatronospira sp. TaxID=1962951 RepID=UPI0025B80490|nr:hypothetical protein [Desulfonatronospira sp.]